MRKSEALTDKYGEAEGLTIKEGKITEWPSSWPTQPTDAEIAQIATDFETAQAPIDAQKAALEATQDLTTIAEKLEEVIEHLDKGTPLPKKTKDWAGGRKTIRGE